jgi:hypothetical protein
MVLIAVMQYVSQSRHQYILRRGKKFPHGLTLHIATDMRRTNDSHLPVPTGPITKGAVRP